MMAGFLPEEIETHIEIRGIYDGWSVAAMKDGRLLNRWPPDDRRHKPTQRLRTQPTSMEQMQNRSKRAWSSTARYTRFQGLYSVAVIFTNRRI